MCRNWDLFSRYETLSNGVVVMENNSLCRIVGIRRIWIKTFDGIIKILNTVRHALDLKRNCIYSSTLDSKVYRYACASGVLKVSKCTPSLC